MQYRARLYIPDYVTLKDYKHRYKLTLFRAYKQPGYDSENGKIVKKCTVNSEKLETNVTRARSKIFEYAMCNPWDQFANLTLDRHLYNRYKLKPYIKDLTQWLRDYSRKHKTQVKYLFIPEQHKDGAWHIHGLLKGIPDAELTEFIPGKHPQDLIDAGYKNWPAYSNRFGYVSCGKIKDHVAACVYMTKYVSKDMATNNIALNERLYFCSKGLKTAQIIKKGFMATTIKPDYENEYVKVQWFDSKQLALSTLRAL
jgi:hypothetical protein